MCRGPVAQHGWSVRLITERSRVQISPGPSILGGVWSCFSLNLRLPISEKAFKSVTLSYELLLEADEEKNALNIDTSKGVTVDGLLKLYGEIKALDRVSFKVEENEIFGLLGPNGAGKTTLIEILCGLKNFDDGKITVFGYDLVKEAYLVRSLIGFCSQETLLYDLLSVYENLAFSASLYSLSRKKFKERVKFFSKHLRLGEFMHRKAEELSGGMKRRANLAMSIIHDPPLIILDEPTVGFDPNVKREFWNLIRSLKDDGKTVIIATHDMYEADELCDRVAIMDKGRIVALDKPSVLKRKIGGEAKLIVNVKKGTEDALKLLKSYKHFREENEIEIFVKNPWVEMPKISSILTSHKVLIEKIEVAEPTLEDVFVKLTGRRLEENFK